MTHEAPLYTTPEEAEKAFYHAFEQADIQAMRQVWGAHDEIECIHPLGPRLTGEAIFEAWEEMFRSRQRLAFHIAEHRRLDSDQLAVHVVTENILFTEGGANPLKILATNVYRRTPQGWRIVLHHASPLPRPAEVAQSQPAKLH